MPDSIPDSTLQDFYISLTRLEERFTAIITRVDTGFAHTYRYVDQILGERQKQIVDQINAEQKLNKQALADLDLRYSEHLTSQLSALAASILAQEKAMLSSMAASDKAIIKAEEAQRDYNVRSNEFRGQIDDQQKTLLPRTEYTTAHLALDDKFVSIQKNYDAQLIRITESFDSKFSSVQISFEDKLKSLQASFEKTTDRNLADIVSLRESRSEVSGRRVGNSELIAILVGVALVLATLLLAFGPAIVRH